MTEPGVIPHGATPVGMDRASEILGKSVGTLRNTRLWEKVRTLSRPAARGTRIFDEPDLVAYRDEAPLPPRPAPHPLDLLDKEAARLAIPEEKRPTPKTWDTYVYATDKDGIGPKPDAHIEGMPFWYRQTVDTWAARPDGRHRTKGSKNKQPTTRAATLERTALVGVLLESDPSVTPAQVAAELGVSTRQAERYLAAAGRTTVRDQAAERRARIDEYVAQNPGATAADIARGLDLNVNRVRKDLSPS
jgi:hypothetical protein